jgi:hypothetical protein
MVTALRSEEGLWTNRAGPNVWNDIKGVLPWAKVGGHL